MQASASSWFPALLRHNDTAFRAHMEVCVLLENHRSRHQPSRGRAVAQLLELAEEE
jgi:hypothetical protein